MRIIEGRDYYDNALAYGQDTSVIFIRSRTDLRTNDDFKHTPISVNNTVGVSVVPIGSDHNRTWRYDNRFSVNHREYTINNMVVYLCGKLYRGLVVREYCLSSMFNTYIDTHHFFWDQVTFEEWLRKKGLEPLRGKSTSWRPIWPIEYYFERGEVTKAVLDYLIENKITILTFADLNEYTTNKKWWTVNGDNLKNLHFFSVMDSFTTFQEISMWVGGVLPHPGNPIVTITDDKVKVHKHGFNKLSFRKEKQAK
jgi:hypothetical protein